MYIVKGVVAPGQYLKLHMQMFRIGIKKWKYIIKSHVCMYVHLQIQIHTYVCMYIHTCMYRFTRMYVCTFTVHSQVHSQIQTLSKYVIKSHVCMYVHSQCLRFKRHLHKLSFCIKICECMNKSHVCIYLHLQIQTLSTQVEHLY